MNDSWEGEIGALLAELADVQTALLNTLNEKRQLLMSGNVDGLAAMSAREDELAARLQACHEQRQQLLVRADAEGLPADSIQSLSDRLPAATRQSVQASIREAANRSQLLRHQCLTNWVVVQRSLLHLSQMIEIIATGGRPKPTYDKGPGYHSGGALVDRAA
ncbi:MAG TPA: flagellar export chaperone FlgN [Lacipirellulaceae bacterium]|nr:flagellar export chaperone FlgN [Lacipirellulaceae bacterium]